MVLISTIIKKQYGLHSSLKCWLTSDLSLMARGQQVCRQVGSCLHNHTAAVRVYSIRADLWHSGWKIQTEVWKRLSGLQWDTENVWEGWENKMFVMIKPAWVWLGACKDLSELKLFSASVWVWVQHSDISSLLLLPLTADYWCYMACGGAPGKLLTPVSALLRAYFDLRAPDSLSCPRSTQQTTYFHVL